MGSPNTRAREVKSDARKVETDSANFAGVGFYFAGVHCRNQRLHASMCVI